MSEKQRKTTMFLLFSYDFPMIFGAHKVRTRGAPRCAQGARQGAHKVRTKHFHGTTNAVHGSTFTDAGVGTGLKRGNPEIQKSWEIKNFIFEIMKSGFYETNPKRENQIKILNLLF